VMLGSLVPSASAAWQEGSSLPELSDFGLEGNLPDLKNKVILIDFWAAWCGPCRKSFPHLQSLHETYSGKGLVILGVSVDQTDKAMKKFLEANKVTFATVRDAAQKLVANAGVKAMPSSYLIDRKGNIRAVHIGFHGNETVEAYEKEIKQLLAE